MITEIEQVICQRGKIWTIITDNWILREFFRSQDYKLWDDDSCGGNIIWWETLSDEVHLQFQLDDPDDQNNLCCIKRDVLLKVINKLKDLEMLNKQIDYHYC